MKVFFLLVFSVAVSMMVIPLAWRLAPHIGMIDQPDPRKVHKVPVPRIGGWGIAAGCLTPLLLLDYVDPLPLSFLLGTLTLFVFGSWDDARQLGHWPKFVGQLLAVGIVVFWGGLYVTRLPFIDGDALSPLAGQLLTMFAMVGVINAINHSDGLDGLAAGETLLSLIALAFLGYEAGSALGLEVALVAIGGIIGFLRYNTHPARVFMGDAGSQVLGFALAFLVVHLVQMANTAVSAALPLLLLGLPIADINAVLYQRARGGMNWFKATRNHVHHRLLDLGFSHYQSVVLIYSFQAVLVTCGVLLRYASDWAVLLLYFSAIATLFLLLRLAERSGWRLVPKIWPQLHAFSAWLIRLRASSRVQSAFAWVIAGSVSALMLIAVLRAPNVPRDFGVTAALAALAAMAVVVSRATWQTLALRVAIYVTVVFSIYLLTAQSDVANALPVKIFGAAIIALAVILGVFVRFVSSRRFGATPTDYLIVFAVIAMLAFGVVAGRNSSGATSLGFITFSIVLFYGCEVVIGHLSRWRSVLGSAALLALTVVAVKGLTTGM